MSLETKSVWEEKTLDSLTGGINLSQRSENLDDSESPRVLNLYTRRDELLVDTGYTPFLSPVRGVPRREIQFFFTDGTDIPCLITNDTFYVKVGEQWQYPQGGDGTATDMAVAGVASDLTIKVTDDTGFSDGDFIGIELDDGTQHQTTINGAPVANVITITDALPSASAIGKYVCRAPVLQGNDGEQISFVIASSVNWLIFTNGVDAAQRFDGTDLVPLPGTPNGGNTVCKALALYKFYLFMINTVEGVTTRPQRARWSELANYISWPANNFIDFVDTEDLAITAEVLGPYLVIYKQKTIIRCSHVGTAAKTFNFDTTITTEGVNGVLSVIALEKEHYFWGQSGIYNYKGGFDITDVSLKVWELLFGTDNVINPSFANRVIGMYIKELGEIWFHYPDVTSEYPNNTLRYDTENQVWMPRQFNNSISGFGFFFITTTRTWNDLIGTWNDQDWIWDSTKVSANSPTVLLLNDTEFQVFEYDYLTGTDNLVDINFEYQTKDFYHPDNLMRFDQIMLEAKGTTLNLQYSLDRGNTWVTIYSQMDLHATYEIYNIGFQFVGKRVRLRVTGSGSGFGIRWFGFRWRPESQH